MPPLVRARATPALARSAIPLTVALGLVVGWYRGEVLAALSSLVVERYVDVAFRIVSSSVCTTLAVLFCRMSGPRSWLPPVMLLGAAFDLRKVVDPHPALLSVVLVSWLLALVLRGTRLTPLRVAVVIVCGGSLIVLQIVGAG